MILSKLHPAVFVLALATLWAIPAQATGEPNALIDGAIVELSAGVLSPDGGRVVDLSMPFGELHPQPSAGIEVSRPVVPDDGIHAPNPPSGGRVVKLPAQPVLIG